MWPWAGESASVPHLPSLAQLGEAGVPVPTEAGPCPCVGGQSCPPAGSCALNSHWPSEELDQVPWGGEQHTVDSGAAGHE